MSFDVTPASLRDVLGRMSDVGDKAIPKAARWAINDVAFDVLRATSELAEEKFDRPTRFTLKAFFVRKATLSNMTATVERKTNQGRRHYLEVQAEGGPRPMGGVERALSANLAYDGVIRAVLPTPYMRKDRHGNMARGRLQQILSGVRAQGDASQNTTAASRRRVGSKRAQYFVPKVDSRLSAGVYERRGQDLRKVLAFSDAAPRYEANFPMEERAEDVAAEAIVPAFRRALARALAET